MFLRRLFSLSVLILFSLLIVSPTFIKADNQNETYQQYLARMKKEIQSYVVQIIVTAPVREGRDASVSASGVAIFKTDGQIDDFSGEVIKYNTFYILTNPHIVSWARKEGELARYQEDNVRIYILGKKNTRAPAQIVAWEWGTETMLLRADIPVKELDNFNIQVAKIAVALPLSLYDAKYVDKEADDVFLCGYPDVLPVVNSGNISQYFYNFVFNYYTDLAKVAAINAAGLNGEGQSGGGIFNQNRELVGIVFGSKYSSSNLIYAVPIDAIVERFLKQLPELQGLTLPKFELEKEIKNKPSFLGRPKKETITAANHLNN